MSATVVAAMSGVSADMLTAVTTGSGTVIAPPTTFIHHNFLAIVAAGVTGGVVTIEQSQDPNDTATWAIVGSTIAASTGGTDQLLEYEGRLMFVRARVTTTISGGGSPSVTVKYTGAQR